MSTQVRAWRVGRTAHFADVHVSCAGAFDCTGGGALTLTSRQDASWLVECGDGRAPTPWICICHQCAACSCPGSVQEWPRGIERGRDWCSSTAVFAACTCAQCGRQGGPLCKSCPCLCVGAEVIRYCIGQEIRTSKCILR